MINIIHDNNHLFFSIDDIARVTCIIPSASELYIQECYVKKEYRNQGYATRLLAFVKDYALKNVFACITLDDATNRFGKPNNIYIKNGFEYIDASEGPEMVYCIST